MNKKVEILKDEFLDKDGLNTLWAKIKTYVNENAATINPDDVHIDLSNYVTLTKLAEEIANVDNSKTVTKTDIILALGYTPANANNIVVDLSNYYTKAQVEARISNIDTSNIDLTSYATKIYVDEVVASITTGGTVDLSSYATKTYVNNRVDTALDNFDLSGDYATIEAMSEALNTKADTEHTHTQYANKVDVPSLRGYATEEYVNGKISDIENGENDNVITEEKPLRKIVYISGTKTYTVEDAPAIPTYDGQTILTFEHPVILRVLLNRPKIITETDYTEYTGSIITIPNTTVGYLTDYIIYNIVPQEETVTDPNIMVKINDFVNDSMGKRYEGYAQYNSTTNVYKYNKTPYGWENARIIELDEPETFEVMIKKDGLAPYYNWYKDYLPTEKQISEDAVLWKDNPTVMSQYQNRTDLRPVMEPLGYGTKASVNTSVAGLANLTGLTCYGSYNAIDIYESGVGVIEALSLYATAKNIRAVMVQAVEDQEYTVESIAGKPFAIMRNASGNAYSYTEREWCLDIELLDDWEVNTSNDPNFPKFNQYARYKLKGYYEAGILDNVKDKTKHDYEYLHLSDWDSADGSAVTFTFTNSSDYTDFFFIICEDEADYSTIKITKGGTSYSEIVNLGNKLTNVTSSDGGDTTNTVVFKLADYTAENEYVRYLSENLYKTYDFDNYYNKEETEQLISSIDLSKYARTEDIPTKVSQLTNDSGFITEDNLPDTSGFLTSIPSNYLRYQIVTAAPDAASQEEGVLYIVIG